MIILHVTYQLYRDEAKAYVDALEASGIPELCRQEEGNVRYDYFYSAAHSDQVLLVELWKDEEAFAFHKQTEHFKRLGALKEQFVKSADLRRFSAEELK